MKKIAVSCRNGLALFLIAFSGQGHAQGFGTSNQAALARGFALPSLGSFGETSVSKEGWRLSAEIITEYVSTAQPSERLLLDGETQSYNLQYRRHLGARWFGGLELGLLHANGGFMDRLVESWHGWFGLPNGGRDRAPRDAYRYFYERDGTVLIDETSGHTGFKDIEMSLGYKLRPGWKVIGMAKLPTASRQALGGQALGAAFWTHYELSLRPSWPVKASLSAGLSVNEKAGALSTIQRDVIPLGGVGLSIPLSARTQIVSHLYLHGPLYGRSNINALDRPGAQLALGIRWCHSSKTCYELLFQEDPIIESSPDFSLRFAVVRR